MEHYNLSYPINTVSWDGKVVTRCSDECFLPTCRTLKQLGVNELMVTGYVTVEEADFDMMEETKRLGGLLDSMGMRPAQHHGLSAMYAPQGESQDRVIEKLIRSIHYTANMNAPVLVIHPGQVDLHLSTVEEYTEYFSEQIRKYGRQEILKTCAANLDTAGEIAGKLGVKIALENVELFAADITLLRDLLDEVKSPNIGFCFDSGHAHYKSASVLNCLDILQDRLLTTHLHDNRSVFDEHMPPGFGTIPWIDIIQGLWKAGYDNTINFESGGWPGLDKETGFELAIQFWRACELLAKKN